MYEKFGHKLSSALGDRLLAGISRIVAAPPVLYNMYMHTVHAQVHTHTLLPPYLHPFLSLLSLYLSCTCAHVCNHKDVATYTLNENYAMQHSGYASSVNTVNNVMYKYTPSK